MDFNVICIIVFLKNSSDPPSVQFWMISDIQVEGINEQ